MGRKGGERVEALGSTRNGVEEWKLKRAKGTNGPRGGCFAGK